MADRQLVAHLLRRATFGPTAAEVDAAEAAGCRRHPRRAGRARPAPTPLAAAASSARDPYAALPPDPERDARQKADTPAPTGQIQALIQWWVGPDGRAPRTSSPRSWSSSGTGTGRPACRRSSRPPLMLGQLQTLRQYGRGDFAVLREGDAARPGADHLAGRPAATPARRPNENLARELMELFTLGIGTYTEDDVKAAARALTGWTVDRATPAVGRSCRAATTTGTKTILGQTADFDADSYADLLVAQPANADVPGPPAVVPVRLRRRRCRRPPQARLVAAYRPGRDVTALLARALRRRGVRRAPAAQLVKQPVEWLVGALRQLGIDPGRRCAGATRRRAAQLLRRAGRARPGAAAAAERRRLAGRRGLADHLVAAGPAAPRRRAGRGGAGRPRWTPLGDRRRRRPSWTRWPGCWSSTRGPTGPGPC